MCHVPGPPGYGDPGPEQGGGATIAFRKRVCFAKVAGYDLECVGLYQLVLDTSVKAHHLTCHVREQLDLQDMAIRDLNEEGATIAPGVDLERVLERIVTRFVFTEKENTCFRKGNYLFLKILVSTLNPEP